MHKETTSHFWYKNVLGSFILLTFLLWSFYLFTCKKVSVSEVFSRRFKFHAYWIEHWVWRSIWRNWTVDAHVDLTKTGNLSYVWNAGVIMPYIKAINIELVEAVHFHVSVTGPISFRLNWKFIFLSPVAAKQPITYVISDIQRGPHKGQVLLLLVKFFCNKK